MFYYLVSPLPDRGDLVHATFTRVRCALTAARRRPDLRLVASTHQYELGQVVRDWQEPALPGATDFVERLPEVFGADWWAEYVS